METEGESFWDSFGDCADPSGPDGSHFHWDRKTLVGMRYLRDPVTKKPRRTIYLVTSYGQLNFFHWALPNGVIDFAETNHAIIYRHMDEVKSSTDKVEKGKRRKLTERRFVAPVQFYCSGNSETEAEDVEWIT